MATKLPLLLMISATACWAGPIGLAALDVAVTENFNWLASSGTSNSLASSLPWTFAEVGGSGPTTYAAGTGSSTTGNTYSFGTAADDRAFGTLRSSSVGSTIGVSLKNLTGLTVASLEIEYAGEQWRLGAVGREDRLDFAYSFDATSLATGTWTNVNALDFKAPTTAGTIGALNGNAAANRMIIASTLTNLGWIHGSVLWLRWSDFDAAGADDGLAIDDFSARAPSPAPVAPTPPQSVPEGSVSALLAVAFAALAAGARRRRAAAV